jgi:hypothetical protein
MTPSSQARSRAQHWLVLLALWLPQLPAHAATTAADGCAYLAQLAARAPGGALFLPSYPDVGPGPLKDAAFLYDNAVAAIALVGCRQALTARRIGDAMLLALDHDRYWHDGRLRNGYAAGRIAAAPLKLAGWWSDRDRRWLEDNYQSGSDSGNVAWAMLALLTLDADARNRVPHDARYLAGALRLAQWLQGQRDRRGAGGFTGGSFGSESEPRAQTWKSTEHNVDLCAAIAWLASASGDAHWRAQSEAALRFVEAMWDGSRQAFAAGTREDGVTRNPLLALDAQIWPLLAMPGAAVRHVAAYTHAAQRLRASDGTGYAYSEAGGGAWIEGTAMAALLRGYLASATLPSAPTVAIDLARASDGGYYATTAQSLPTGFMLDTDPAEPRVYRHLEHLGAAAWVALWQQRFNPFTGARALPQ